MKKEQKELLEVDPRARRAPRRGGSPPQAGEPAQAVHPAGAPIRHRPAAFARREVRHRHRHRRRGNARNTIVPNYVTESAYTEDIPGRSNVGDTQSRTRLALIDAATGDVK